MYSIIPDIKGYEIFSNDKILITPLVHEKSITSSHLAPPNKKKKDKILEFI